ncbi:MAG: hypothetical protein SFW66_05675 [Gammaproteobacteria bacterium]|nr:hypothetical protein [Gammaproteobacteria bacterium]
MMRNKRDSVYGSDLTQWSTSKVNTGRDVPDEKSIGDIFDRVKNIDDTLDEIKNIVRECDPSDRQSIVNIRHALIEFYQVYEHHHPQIWKDYQYLLNAPESIEKDIEDARKMILETYQHVFDGSSAKHMLKMAITLLKMEENNEVKSLENAKMRPQTIIDDADLSKGNHNKPKNL